MFWCWFLNTTGSKKKVYDVTKFLDQHPGGSVVITEYAGFVCVYRLSKFFFYSIGWYYCWPAGKDASEAFESTGHSTSAKQQMTSYYVGDLIPSDDPRQELQQSTPSSTSAAATMTTVDSSPSTVKTYSLGDLSLVSTSWWLTSVDTCVFFFWSQRYCMLNSIISPQIAWWLLKTLHLVSWFCPNNK